MINEEKLQMLADEVTVALNRYLPRSKIAQAVLIDAMRYSLLSGGKRVRPILLLEFFRISGGNTADAMPFACALEMIHTYSLIHDDLPAMDDDDYRRGKLCSHKVYGEATAILAGDALQSAAFEIMLNPESVKNLDKSARIEAAYRIASASGAFGMAGGQQLDLHPENVTKTEINRLKTGALIVAAAEAGCIIGGADNSLKAAAVKYATDLGLAFQARDDELDGESSTGKLSACQMLTENAVSAISGYSGTEFLQWLAFELGKREK